MRYFQHPGSADPPVGSFESFVPRGKLGLLLGAGGIRGCAHVGVMSVMDSISLAADIVVGASIGSIFGAGYAAGWDVATIRRLTDQAPRRAVAEFYLNRLRIDRTTYIGSILCELGTETLIEDLPRRFAAMVEDRDTGRVIALTRGPLLRAVEASIALPGIARPVHIGASRYIDGGLRASIPSSVARQLGAESIIRVELVGANPLKLAYKQMRRWRTSSHLPRWVRRDRAPATLKANHKPLEPGGEPANEITIAPRFFGLFCNAPLGVGFCADRGRIAATSILANIDLELGHSSFETTG